MQEDITYFAIAYSSLCKLYNIMVTTTSHIFTNIFQMVNFPAVKFTRGNEKNMSFLLIPQFPKVWKNLKQSDRTPLKLKMSNRFLCNECTFSKCCVRIKTHASLPKKPFQVVYLVCDMHTFTIAFVKACLQCRLLPRLISSPVPILSIKFGYIIKQRRNLLLTNFEI